MALSLQQPIPASRPLHIGQYTITPNVVLAPMAGVTDLPFRRLCKHLGAGAVTAEMVASNPALRKSVKSQLRLTHAAECSPRIAQIVGADPKMMADAAQYNVDKGAQIIDINMGCPAKKVCRVAAGSALLQNEQLVGTILDAVVVAVQVPVTLKIRTGWDPEHRNALGIAKIAEAAGIAAITVHGRTRACGFSGEVEYETIRAIKQAIIIPVIANGDICSPEKAAQVLAYTGADAVMIGRAAQGNPWIFQEVSHFLSHGKRYTPPRLSEVRETLLTHLESLYSFYGEFWGVRIARKHIGWYLNNHARGGETLRRKFNQLDAAEEQKQTIRAHFAA